MLSAMHRTRTIVLAVAPLLAVTASLTLAGHAQADPAANAPADQFAELTGVATLSVTNAWAVGDDDAGSQTSTLVQHWDGSTWTQVASPSPGGPYGSELKGVSAVGPASVWAVGTYQVESSAFKPLIEHWNGRQWNVVAPPSFGQSQDVELDAVSAVSSTDVWAVGVYDPPGPDTQASLAIHWDGTAWSIVSTPHPSGTSRYLLGVSATSSASGWAVGASTGLLGDGLATDGIAPLSTMALRWNGHTWSRSSTPNAGSESNQLNAVSTVQTGSTWAVGSYANNATTSFGLVEHFVGGVWHRVTVPGLGAGTTLDGVSGSVADDVWIVGRTGGFSNPVALMAHWDGTSWHVYTGPGPAGITMQGVVDDGVNRTWSVGIRAASNGFFAVRESWNGHVWAKR